VRKLVFIFVAAVLLPSLILAWLAAASLRDQQFVLERQQPLLHQSTVDAVATELNTWLDDRQHELGEWVETFAASNRTESAAAGFDDWLRQRWTYADAGFAVSLADNRLLSPQAGAKLKAQEFVAQNSLFLMNQQSENAFTQSRGKVGYDNLGDKADAGSSVDSALASESNKPAESPTTRTAQTWSDDRAAGQRLDVSATRSRAPAAPAPVAAAAPLDVSEAKAKDSALRDEGAKNAVSQMRRNVMPQKKAEATESEPDVSKFAAAPVQFNQVVAAGRDGTIARYVDDTLQVLLWCRPAGDDNRVFGARLNLTRAAESVRSLLGTESRRPGWEDICVAVLNDKGAPVAVSRSGFTANWRRPFVAAEAGERLPHWEVAAYLVDADAPARAARSLRLTVGLLIATMLAAIGIGGWLIARDLGRELRLARQKTDFVSNVSHELKTPLTSIRMFSELLAEGKSTDETKRSGYARIISSEASRLSRLINNVLDFARLERGERRHHPQTCDLRDLVLEAMATYLPHLEAAGFQMNTRLPEHPLPVQADRDGVSQILVNLVSNAEKYGGDAKHIEVEAAVEGDRVVVRVMDRGLGVPRQSEGRLFEKFFRAHDSLDSGIAGSGLGLTLARGIARQHGGDVTYQRRDGGGSIFTFHLPLHS
jgi:signal transduction histidine kinase